MKIAFVVHTAYPEFIGGRERHIHNLATALSATDEVIVFAGSKTKVIERCKVNNYTLVRLPMISIRLSRNPLQIYRIIPGLLSNLKKERFDLIHAFEYGSYSTNIAHLYSKKHGIPLILTVYGYQLNNPILKILKKFYDYFIGKPLLKSVKKIFCVSDIQLREILRIAGEKNIKEKVVVQVNCILVENYKDITVKKSLLNRYDLNGKIKLLTIARILPRKGIKYLIFALDNIIKKYRFTHIKLIIIGPNCGEENTIKRLIKKLRLEKNVLIIGPIPYSHVKDFLGICDIFILPSLYEGFPLMLLEAMAVGKAVIFTDLPYAQKIITHGKDGLLVEPANVDSLTRAILRVSSNKKFREYLGFNAKRKAERFDSYIEAQKVRKIYEEAMASVTEK